MYAKARKQFTAADLQKYTEIEEGIPMEQTLAELKKLHRQLVREQKRKKEK